MCVDGVSEERKKCLLRKDHQLRKYNTQYLTDIEYNSNHQDVYDVDNVCDVTCRGLYTLLHV
jgi:hypothetical protein